MSRKNDLQGGFDGLSSRLRDETPPREVEAAAAERVWARLGEDIEASAAQAEPGRPFAGCADYMGLVPAWNAGRLPEGRRLLIEDHLRGCVTCRRAIRLREADEAGREAAPKAWPVESRSRLAPRWAIAATILLAAALGGVAMFRSVRSSGELARVEQVQGSMFLVSGSQTGMTAASRTLGAGEGVRTGKDSLALVRLADGSRIEMKERSEISLQPRSDGMAIRLAHGSVIVEAARQPRGSHLFVATGDCLVSVVGTIFSVTSGTKGSRVSVVEGEVRVAQRGEESVLRPGDQVATAASLTALSVEDDISWSQDAEEYREVLRRLAGLRAELTRTVPAAAERHSTRLLDLSPRGTIFYAAVPNLGESLAEGRHFLKTRIEQDELLHAWWASRTGESGDGEIDRVLEEVRLFSSRLGPEIALSIGMNAQGEIGAPLLVAELKNPEEFHGYLAGRMEEARQSGSAQPVRLLPAELPADAGENTAVRPAELLLWVRDDILAASPSLEALRAFADTPAERQPSPFLDRIAASYRTGAEYIVSADLHTILRDASERGLRELTAEPARARRLAIEQTGLLGLESLMAEAKDLDGRRQERLVLGFDGLRRGLASWLADPAPMGGLDYVSPDARFVAAFVVKEPVAMIEDILAIGGAANQGDAGQPGENIPAMLAGARDIASAFGGEVVFALDGPLLPVPAWKLLVEVPDAAALERALTQAVEAASRNGSPVTLETDRQPERTFYTIRCEGAPFELQAAWDGGYLVAGPTRALVERTLAQKTAGASLRDAPGFTALLPQDSYENFSAILYENLSGAAGALGTLAGTFAGGAASGENKGLAEAFSAFGASAAGPSLFCAYSEPDRIVLAGSSPATMISDMVSLLTFGGLAQHGPPASPPEAQTER